MENTDNLFIKAIGANDTITENGAISNSSTGKAIIDQFGKAANYNGRPIDDVFKDQATLWKENKELALRFPFYLRLVTRKTKFADGFVTEKVQMGQGVRDEAFKRLLWIAKEDTEVFNRNLWLLPLVGSWKDLWMIMYYDIHFDVNVINREVVYNLILQGLSCKEYADLIKKFMPRIKSSSKVKTEWTKAMNKFGREFIAYANISLKESYKLKASGKAHEFQKKICGKMFDQLKWNEIPGRALNLLVNSKFLEKHQLVDNYLAWLDKQPTVKFTGYVHELGHAFNMSSRKSVVLNHTLDKQFQTLIGRASENEELKSNVWCALDTSGSMSWSYADAKKQLSALDVCLSLGIFFSTLNKGAFHKNVIMFDSTSRVKQLEGTFTEMLRQVPMDAMGSTNFQSVVDEIVRIRKANPQIPLEDYPTTLLVVSDMQFNPTFYREGLRINVDMKTNYQVMKEKLAEVFPSEFVDSMKFIWWDVTSRKNDFPARMDDSGCYVVSGFDGSLLSLILHEEEKETKHKVHKTMEEVVTEALSQEILMHIH